MPVPERVKARLSWLVLIVACGLVSPAVTGAWGMDVHRWITERALDGLPPELKPFFAAERAFIAEHSVDPDLWRVMDLKGVRGDEPPNHFLDMDFEVGSVPPFTNIPRDYDAYVAKYGIDLATRYGRLPWRAEDVYDRLVAAFRDIGKPSVPYAADNARYLTAVLAHYVEDAHQPFHGALNYDGQLTNQRGIHARFETELVLRYRKTLALAPVKVTPIAGFRDFMFATLVESQSLVEAVLVADRKAIEGREFYDAGYFEALLKGTKPIVERRLSDAASGLASAVFSAWVEAGRPLLPEDGPTTPVRIRR
jgi:hypothetical protein